MQQTNHIPASKERRKSQLILWSLLGFVSLKGFAGVRAFTTSAPLVTTQQQPSPLLLQSSFNNNNNDGEDEISKLLGRRSQIKRTGGVNIEKTIKERLANTDEPTVELNLDALPSLTEKRRQLKRQKDDESDEVEEDTIPVKEAPPIVDYLADYDDENDFHIPNRIVATGVCWGDTNQGFVPSSKQRLTKRAMQSGKFLAGDVLLGVTALLEGGVTVMETSPHYGSQSRSAKLSSEQILGKCLKDIDPDSVPEPLIVTQTRLSPLNLLLRPGATAVSSLEDSLESLGGESAVELFVARQPSWMPSTRFTAAALAAQIESGQANRVGVAGITSPAALRRLCRHLENADCTLTAAVFDFSLTNPKAGAAMIDACQECQVVPLISDPLDGGLASGVYTALNPSGGLSTSTKFTFRQLEPYQQLHSVLETVAERVSSRVRRNLSDTQNRFRGKYGPPPKINTDITTTHVALQWIIAKGGVPLVSVNSPMTAKDCLGCLGWTLDGEEVALLDSAVGMRKR